ncbi:MAG: hypothetical protein HQL08_06990 [Nitrospirae bacterium]|nr:hypothetical protein [Nitrospirota bacterium]
MKKESLALLLGFVSNQKAEIDKLCEEIKGIKPENKENTVYIGYCLHNVYCAFEDLFKEVARTFENQIEDVARYHRDLLKRMILDVPGIRPPLLSRDSFRVLDELRRFRHMFRHAYTYELESQKVNDLQLCLLAEYRTVIADIEVFTGFLRSKIRE